MVSSTRVLAVADNEALVKRINAYRPDLLMVGMGMPRQEYWTQDNFSQLDVHVILSSTGAALEYIAGAAPTPPRWAGRIGLEWMFRLAHEPRRLFSRYLIEPWYILLLLLMDYPRSRCCSESCTAGARRTMPARTTNPAPSRCAATDIWNAVGNGSSRTSSRSWVYSARRGGPAPKPCCRLGRIH